MKDTFLIKKRTSKDSTLYKAALITMLLPMEIDFGNLSVERTAGSWTLTTSAGEKRVGELLNSVWIQHAPGDVDICALTEKGAADYDIVHPDGSPYAPMAEHFLSGVVY